MFSALMRGKMRIVSFKAEKSDGPFYCPECGDEVILRKGDIRVPHFAHTTPDAQCDMRMYSEAESPQHRLVKFDIYSGLKRSGKFTVVDMEYRVGHSVADVYGEKEGVRVAIEVQHSDIQIGEIAARMQKYAENDVYCAWVSPVSAPFGQVRTKGWLRFVHAMNLGRVYHHFHGSSIYAVNYRRYAEYEPGQSCDEHFYSQRRLIFRHLKPLNLAEFAPVRRLRENYNGYLHIGLPEVCLLWHDNQTPWWLNSIRGWDEIMQQNKYRRFDLGRRG